AGLPDPLLAPGPHEGEKITTVEGWEQHRPHLEAQLQKWIVGSIPPAPDSVEATVLKETEGTNATTRELELRFGPENTASLWCEVMIPEGEGPFPVFMTQHNHRAWAMIALRRGYIAVIYAGSDSRDDTDTFLEAYPDHDWSR